LKEVQDKIEIKPYKRRAKGKIRKTITVRGHYRSIPKKMDDEELFKECVNHWGTTSQILMVIEELSELIVELCHSLRANKPFNIEQITEELADAKLMLDQLQFIFNISDIELNNIRKMKMKRIKELIESEKNLYFNI